MPFIENRSYPYFLNDILKNLNMFPALREKLNTFILVLKETSKSFQKNNNFEMAATLSFYSFFALIPLLLLAVYPIGTYLISSQSAIEEIERLFPKQFPEINKVIIKEVSAIARHRALWETFTFVTLLGLITPFAKACRTAFSKIFRFEREFSFFKAKLWDSLGVLLILVMFMLLVLCEFLYSLYVDTSLIDLPTVLDISYLLAPFFIALIALFFFYFFFVPIKLKWLHLLIGSLLTVSLWSLIRPAFSLVLQINPNYGFAFGSLKTIFFLVIWVYYSFAVMLAGAEVMANMKRKEALLFRGLFFNHKAGRKIPNKYVKVFEVGEVVFKEGEVGREMYYILSGAATINKEGKVLKVIGEGDYFGEIAMLLNTPRTATITVVEPDTRLVCISQDNFEILLRENPSIVLAILKEMSARLKETDAEACQVVL
jgi:membrane protein